MSTMITAICHGAIPEPSQCVRRESSALLALRRGVGLAIVAGGYAAVLSHGLASLQ